LGVIFGCLSESGIIKNPTNLIPKAISRQRRPPVHRPINDTGSGIIQIWAIGKNDVLIEEVGS
jgi:hypothetical protein